MSNFRAIDSFYNPGVLVVVDCLSLFVLFSEPPNSGSALAPQQSTVLSKVIFMHLFNDFQYFSIYDLCTYSMMK